MRAILEMMAVTVYHSALFFFGLLGTWGGGKPATTPHTVPEPADTKYFQKQKGSLTVQKLRLVIQNEVPLHCWEEAHGKHPRPKTSMAKRKGYHLGDAGKLEGRKIQQEMETGQNKSIEKTRNLKDTAKVGQQEVNDTMRRTLFGGKLTTAETGLNMGTEEMYIKTLRVDKAPSKRTVTGEHNSSPSSGSSSRQLVATG